MSTRKFHISELDIDVGDILGGMQIQAAKRIGPRDTLTVSFSPSGFLDLDEGELIVLARAKRWKPK